MNLEELKKAILEELELCDDRDLLLDVLIKFYHYPESKENENSVNEPQTHYVITNDFKIPEWKWKQLEEDSEKLKRGELELTDWDDFEASLKKEYDL